MKMLFRMMMILGLGATLWAQAAKSASQAPANQQSSERPDARREPDLGLYKLSFVLYELEDGKRTNQRDYSMIGKVGGTPANVRVFTRVPMFSEEKKVNYINAGVDIRCSLKDPLPDISYGAGKVLASCEFEISSFVLPDQPGDGHGTPNGAPVLRSTNASTWALLTPGKAAVISTIDDLNSKKRTQIELTATKVD